jgi:gliding motility-associated-like protein
MFFLPVVYAAAQRQNNNWTFGFGCRVDFNGLNPDGALNSFLMSSEQCATVSDPQTGSLLFYTDGVKVWNASGLGMPNGNDLMGGTFLSSSQGPAIVPFPDNPDKYFIFTLDELEFDVPPLYNGLRYSVVDMKLNGGKGDVEASNKNVLLTRDSLTEKLTVIRSEAIRGFWVIVHRCNSNEFLAYKVSGCEVSSTPVVSAVGSPLIIPAGDQNNRFACWGSMKANPEGTRLGMPIDGSAFIEFFDFNPATGIFSNPLAVEVSDNTLTPPIRKYGCCFSPDGSKFFFTNTISIYQLDLANYEASAIAASNTLVGTPANPVFQIEQAPNGKLYAAVAGNALAAINFPNNAGTACAYQSNALTLNGNCQLGLPAHVPERNFAAPPFNLVYDCATLKLNATLSGFSDTGISWDMGVPNSNLKGSTVSFNYTDTGTVTIKASFSSDCFSFSVDTSVFIDFCGVKCNEIFIPTIFSPNDKGPQTNETFCVFSDCVEQFKLFIHNRWGEKVFESDDINNCWDGSFKGSAATDGVYAYNISIMQTSGKVFNKTGTITLIR